MNNPEDERIETSRDRDWVVRMENRLSDTKFGDRNREPTIYRVPDILKKVDHEAYEPMIVSLGPYHRDKPHLQAMNQLKWKYLNFALDQNSGMVLNDYVDLIEKLEKQARDAYSEKVEMSSNSFVEMMLLDGCFVILTIMEWNILTKRFWWIQFEVAEEWSKIIKRDFETKISKESTWWTRSVVVRDIFLLENQLPFFFLETLYKSAFPSGPSFRKLTLEFICTHFSRNLEHPSDNEVFHHIIHLFHSCIEPKANHSRGNQSSTFGFPCNWKLSKLRHRSLSWLANYIPTVRDANPEVLEVGSFPWFPSATVLNEAGIHFVKKKSVLSFLDITFHNGKLEIPQLQIDERTNSLLRNLIAYEQCSMGHKFHVSSYAMLMDYIINTAEDVELLQNDEIIISGLGDNQVVATLFNKLPLHVIVPWNDKIFLFFAINAILKQRNTRYSRWRSMLNRNYFNNPWTVISLFAALFLFVFTGIQTIYAILSYGRS